jgi:hypothetical protein
LRALLVATTIPFVAIAVPVVAQTTEWTFEVQTLTHSPPWAYAKTQPMGPYATRDDCEKARAEQTSLIDQGNLSQFHLPPNAPTITETEERGASRFTRQYAGGPTEALFASECRTVSDFQTQQITRVPETVTVDDCGKTPRYVCASLGQRMGWPPQRMRTISRRHALQPGTDPPTSDVQRLW